MSSYLFFKLTNPLSLFTRWPSLTLAKHVEFEPEVEDPCIRFPEEGGNFSSIEEWKPPSNNEKPACVREEAVSEWLQKSPPDSIRAGLHLLVIRNKTEKADLKVPMTKDTLQILFEEWKFPPPDELLYALYAGGSETFKPCSDDAKRISMILIFSTAFSSFLLVAHSFTPNFFLPFPPEFSVLKPLNCSYLN